MDLDLPNKSLKTQLTEHSSQSVVQTGKNPTNKAKKKKSQ